jgi:hypothetical protein
MIPQHSSELEELKISLQLICQEMGQYQETQLNMTQNVQALHSTVQEVAQAMSSMMTKLNQFTFPAPLPPPLITHTLHKPPTSLVKQAWAGSHHEAT